MKAISSKNPWKVATGGWRAAAAGGAKLAQVMRAQVRYARAPPRAFSAAARSLLSRGGRPFSEQTRLFRAAALATGDRCLPDDAEGRGFFLGCFIPCLLGARVVATLGRFGCVCCFSMI